MKTLLLFLFTCCCGRAVAEEASPANAHLLKAVLPELKLDGADLQQAIDLLRDKTEVGEKQVNFVLPPETKAETRKVTLNLRGISGMDALATILQMTGTRAEIKRGSIWILPNP